MSESITVNGLNWVIVEIDQLSADEVFIHIKDGDFEYKGIITGGSDE